MFNNKALITPLGLVGITILSGVFLISSNSFATDNTDAVDDVSITVPVSCSMEGTGMTSHNANIVNGTYQADIGSTTLKAFCNDEEGFAIYAIGFTDDEYGKTVLTNSALGSTYDIATGTATSGNTSNWAMKLATNTSATYALTLDNGFGSYSSVPATYTKVAHRDSGTDTGTSATGSELTSTYAAYMNQTQPAGTYTGKVKYTMVHPNNAPAPTPPMTFDDAYAKAGKQKVGNYYAMQDMSSSICSAVTFVDDESETTLIDSRDNKTYTVSKLKDGNCWMTQNLDHNIVTDGSVAYTPTTTDVPATWTPSTATYPTGTTTWNYSNTTPESYDPGELYWSGTPDDSTPVSTGDSHYHLGNYYNWTAAVAMNDSSSYTTDNQDANQSICPANWTLPKSGYDTPASTAPGSFQYLVTQYGWDSSSQTMTNPNIWNSPIKASLSGNWSGSLGGVGASGVFWSPMVDGSAGSYYLRAYSGGYVGPDHTYDRRYGISVRCLAR